MTETSATTAERDGPDVVLLEPTEVDEDTARRAAEAVRRRRLSMFTGRHDQDFEPRKPVEPIDEQPTPPASG